MDVETLRALRHGPGVQALERAIAGFDAGADPLLVATEVRREWPGLAPEVASAALTQARLRRRGREKFGVDADRMWFTPDGLEQATRTTVADHRAARFASLAARLGRAAKVADLCCGVGGDLRALSAAGCAVTGYDRDSLTVEVARANAEALELEVAVECLDVEKLDLSSFDAAFIDPARRRDGRRVFDIHSFSPPWTFVKQLLQSRPAAAKLAPGIPHELIPVDIEAEWVSLDGGLKEAVLWSRDLATPQIRRRATVLPAGETLTDLNDAVADVTTPRRFLYEPDPAVVRAHLIGAVAEIVRGGLLDASTAYVTSDRHVPTPFARAFEITDVMPFSLKRLRQTLRERGVGSVTIMKRGSAVDVEQLRRDLRMTGRGHAVVVLALVNGRREVLLARPVTQADSGQPV
ncbi:MAG TPA: methyltransferase domain-containing protein [Acidothermaceae bacterium]